MTNPEHASILAFISYCKDDEKETFSHSDLTALNFSTRRPVSEIRSALESAGLTLEVRPPVRKVRGFTTSSNDRWFGPGADKTHGGSGFDNF